MINLSKRMKKGPGGVILPGLFVMLVFVASGFAEDHIPSEKGKQVPQEVEKDIPQVERIALLKRFIKAQTSEVKAVQAKQKKDLANLVSSQKARMKEWKEKEKEARHKYFKSGVKRAEKRAYLADYFEREKSMIAMMEEEKKKRISEHAVFLDSVKADQSTKLTRFKEVLETGKKPPQSLWPEGSPST